jgi:hypothetical protein
MERQLRLAKNPKWEWFGVVRFPAYSCGNRLLGFDVAQAVCRE